MTLEEAYLKVRAFVAQTATDLAGIELVTCAEVRGSETPKPRSRAFMHTGHLPGKICFAPPTRLLSLNYVVGILLHEFGHLGSDGGEVEADTWVARKLGVALEYKGKLCLEWVDDATVRRILASAASP